MLNRIKSDGFSLLELLTTMTIFSAIMTLLLSSIHQLSQQNEKVQHIITLRQESRILERIIKEDIMNAIYLKHFMEKDSTGISNDRKTGIVGEDNQLDDIMADQIHMHVHQLSKFHHDRPINHDPELYEVSYYLEKIKNSPKAYNLMRREELYLDDDITEGDRGIAHILTNRIQLLDIVYFDKNNTSSEKDWDSGEKGYLPSAVKVHFSLKNNLNETQDTTFQINLRPNMGDNVKWADQ